MGVMTDSMKRLRSEVEVLRMARGELVEDLAQGTKQRRDAVAMMQAGFRKAHGDMARNGRAERRAYITGQKRAIAHLRKAFASDLAGGHRAWFCAKA